MGWGELPSVVTLGRLKSRSTSRRSQRKLQFTFNLGLEFGGFEDTNLEPNPQIQLDINIVNPRTGLRIVLGKLRITENHHVLALKHSVQVVGLLVTLIKPGQLNRIETLILVVSPSLDLVIVDADALVGVSDGHVEGQVVVEGVAGGGVVELGERGVVHIEFNLVGSEYEPDYEEGNADDDEDGAQDLEHQTAEAAAQTP